MRLFVASGIFDPEPGGPATYLRHFLPEVQAHGHDVTVLTFGDTPMPDRPYPVTSIPRTSYLSRQWAYYRAGAELWPGHDIAYVHSVGLPLPLDASPCVIKVVGDPAWERAMNKGWIPPGTDIDDFQAGNYGPKVLLNKLLRDRYVRACDHVIVPSTYLKNMVANWGVSPEKITVIYNALRTNDVLENLTRADARDLLGLPADVPLLFTAARLTSWKGVDHSIRALQQVPDVHLVVAGDGPVLPALTAQVESLGMSDRIHLMGRIPRERMGVYYRAVDYTLLYSGYEGLPHVLLESLYLGTPVIASNKGGNPEVVRHGVNGLLAPYVDVDALANTIRQAFTNGHQARLSSQTAVDLGRFQWPDLVAQTLAVLADHAS